jgi:hypothetical protein
LQAAVVAHPSLLLSHPTAQARLETEARAVAAAAHIRRLHFRVQLWFQRKTVHH